MLLERCMTCRGTKAMALVRRVSVLDFCYCDKMHNKITEGRNWFILAHSFRVFGPWLLGPRGLGRTLWWREGVTEEDSLLSSDHETGKGRLETKYILQRPHPQWPTSSRQAPPPKIASNSHQSPAGDQAFNTWARFKLSGERETTRKVQERRAL
jgi:hypothetical protein